MVVSSHSMVWEPCHLRHFLNLASIAWSVSFAGCLDPSCATRASLWCWLLYS
jgi:hypothetical protein